MILKPVFFRLLVITAIISMACSLPFGAATSTPQPTTVDPVMATPITAVETVTGTEPTPDFYEGVQKETITGLMDNYETRLAAGEWSEEEGLVATLGYVAGEAEMETINPQGEEIISKEGSDVVRAAGAYIKSGPDTATRAELETLLKQIFIDTDTLERLSVPAGQANSSGNARLAKIQTQDVDCSTLWSRRGFPTDTATTCFEYRSVNIGGSEFRLFIPVDLAAGDNRLIMADGLMENLPTAVNAFLAYGAMPNTDIVLTLLPGRSLNVQAATWMNNPGEHCQIAVYPYFGEIGDPAVANQVLAHELFHCFQFHNYYTKTVLYGSGSKWWVEGTAEFFGNVAYPSVNAEFEYLESFAFDSLNASLVEMDYPNFVFFQYLANQRGEGAVIDLIAMMPEMPGLDGQLAKLSGYPDIQNLFHEFGRAYIDRTIFDTSGVSLPYPIAFDETIRLASSNDYPIPVGDFILERRILVFPDDTLHTLSENYDPSLTVAIRPRGGSVDTWTQMPTSMAACEEKQIAWLGTSARGDGGEQTYTLTDEVEEREVSCDRCLVGTWRLNNDSMWTAFENLTSSSTDGMLRPTLESFDGEAVVRFSADGSGSVTYNGYNIIYFQEIPMGEAGVMRADANVNIEGTGAFVWYTVGNTNLMVPFVLSQPLYNSTLTMTGPDGTSRDMPSNTPPIVIPSEGTYTCSPTTLLIDNGGFAEPIQYDKVSP